jgi:hypothetical protein
MIQVPLFHGKKKDFSLKINICLSCQRERKEEQTETGLQFGSNQVGQGISELNVEDTINTWDSIHFFHQKLKH